MEKKLYQTPTMYVVGIRLATGICSGIEEPGKTPSGGPGSEWENTPTTKAPKIA